MRHQRHATMSFERSSIPANDIARIAPAFRHVDGISTAGTRKLLP
ncbi:hypothetical protein BN2497_10105 [Janthinobacterium sp. CG23_2]|nr:hypothetical protein BN2497_10105 [Janthinobacterium sp. CG23_2]CUU31450.1 hypothetical protein BN3177_10105 [Janthinobacterium sp. CG23_2]